MNMNDFMSERAIKMKEDLGQFLTENETKFIEYIEKKELP